MGFLALLIAASPALGQANTMVYGQGRLSCASWTGNPMTETDTHGWILGYWTGLNMYNSTNHVVGASTDSQGIVGEVRRVCLAQPSKRLFRAISDVYERLMAEGQ